jgi:hypothetical protein
VRFRHVRKNARERECLAVTQGGSAGEPMSVSEIGGVAPSNKGGEGVQPESQINPKGGVQPSLGD